MIDLGTGNNNKINWAMEDKQEMIDIVETIYRSFSRTSCTMYILILKLHDCRGARKGRGLVVSPKDYSTKYRY